MARFLFVVPPLTGHVNPTVSVAGQLQARGHEVAWVGHPGKVRGLLPEHAELYELDDSVPEALAQSMSERASNVRGLAALKFLWEDFLIPLGSAMVPGVTQAVLDFEPTVLVADQQALAGGVVARKQNLPWATSATTSAGVTAPLSALPKVQQWLEDCLTDFQSTHGLSPMERPDRSPHLVLIFSTQKLAGPQHDFPQHYRFVGPSIDARPDDSDFPWDALNKDVPRLLVSLGTVNPDRGRNFYQSVVMALGDNDDLQVILAAPPELVGPTPDNILLRPWIPQLAVLPHMSAVLCHAGHNTVCESLAHGLPLIVAPIKDDQPVVAQQVVDAGAGVRIRFGRVTPAALEDAVQRVLHEPEFRENAESIRDSFQQAGGARAAADALEALC